MCFAKAGLLKPRGNQGCKVDHPGRAGATFSAISYTVSSALPTTAGVVGFGYIGVMFAGRFGNEAVLFRLVAQLEKTAPWFDRVPRI